MKNGLVMRSLGMGQSDYPTGGAATEGVLLMIASTFFLACSNAMVRALSPEIHPFQTGFFLNLIGLLTIWPWVRHEGRSVFRIKAPVLHAVRALIGAATLMAWMWALAHVELAKATAVTFTAPFFAALGAVLLLREKLSRARWMALCAGFAGTLVILRPGMVELDTGTLVALLAALGMATMYVTTKMLLARESSPSVIVNTAVLLTPISLVPAIPVWQWPAPSLWLLILCMGVMGTLGRIFLTTALRAADAACVLPFDFGRLIFISAIGVIVFGETLDGWVFAGSLIIVIAAVWLMRAESRSPARTSEPQSVAPVTASPGDTLICPNNQHH